MKKNEIRILITTLANNALLMSQIQAINKNFDLCIVFNNGVRNKLVDSGVKTPVISIDYSFNRYNRNFNEQTDSNQFNVGYIVNDWQEEILDTLVNVCDLLSNTSHPYLNLNLCITDGMQKKKAIQKR